MAVRTHPTRLILATLAALPGLLCAQSETNPPPGVDALPEPGLFWGFETSASHGFESGFDNAPFEASGANFLIDGGFLKRFEESFTQLGVDGFYGITQYDYGKNFGTTQPFDRTNELSLRVTFGQPFNRQWALVAFTQTSWAWAKDAKIEDGLNASGIIGGRYNFGRGRSVTFGLLARTSPEDDERILPIVGVDWRFNEEWRIYTFNGVYLEWRRRENPLFGLFKDLTGSVEYNSTTFALDDLPADGALPDRQAISIREIVAKIAATMELTDQLDLVVFASVVPWQEWEFRAENEDTATWERDFSARVGATLRVVF